MSVTSAVTAGRAAAESRMTSRCTIRRKTGNKVIDADNQEVLEWVTVHTDLPLRIASTPSATRSRSQTPGEAEIERATPRADFPASTSDLADNDHIEVTSGESTGRVFRIIDAGQTDQSTARRVPVEETERPTEWGA